MSKPSNCITVAEARELQDNWVETRAVYIEKEQNSEEIREFLFSVADLQKFLDYVKEGTEGYTPGIRIYIGAYGPSSSNQATVFLAPTLGVTAGCENNYDLEPLNRSIQGFPPKNY